MVEHNLRLVQPWITRVLVTNQAESLLIRDDPASPLDAEQLQRYYFGEVLIVVMMDSEPLSPARSRAALVATMMGEDIEVVRMTYSDSLMSRELLLRNRLFVLDLFRAVTHPGLRAEGVYVAERIRRRFPPLLC